MGSISMKQSYKVYYIALLAVMLWSTVAVAFKIALAYMDYIQLLFISSAISTFFLFGTLLVRKRFYLLFTYSRNQYLNSILLGILNPFAYYIVLFKAYSILPAQLAQPLNYTWPVVLVLLSAPLLKQKLHFKSVVAILISFFGVYIIAMRDNFFDFKIEQPLGIFLASGSSVIWALFWIFNVKDSRSEVEKLALSFFFSMFFTSLALCFFSEIQIPDAKGMLAAVYVGFFEMGFTFILWLMALQMAERSDKISNFVYISPFFSLIWIHLVLKESIFNTTLIGLFLIIAGILVQQFTKKVKI
jgi:drug/metabolite transporter (DMT)-like permease